MSARGSRYSNHILQTTNSCVIPKVYYRNRLQYVGRRTMLSASEPRRRLPIQIQSMKKDVRKMQHQIAHSDFKVVHFPIMQMGCFIAGLTYTLCYFALDPDQLADAQVEIAMFGYKGFIEHLLDPNYEIGQALDEDDDDDEFEFVDEDEEEDHELYEYYYEDEEQ